MSLQNFELIESKKRTNGEYDLKPCPFCGGEPIITSRRGRYQTRVKCMECNCNLGEWFASKNAAAEAWNIRAERTCTISIGEGERRGWWVCDSCGDMFDSLSGLACKANKKPNYCPNCGAKVVDA